MVRILLIGVFMVSGMLISACEVTDRPALDLPPLMLSPVPDGVVSGTCDEADVLESWLQAISFQYRDFLTLMRDGVDKPPDALYADVEQMLRLRDSIATTPVPECAGEARTLLLDAMAVPLAQFVIYANETEEVNLNTVVAEADADFQLYNDARDGLLEILDGQLQQP